MAANRSTRRPANHWVALLGTGVDQDGFELLHINEEIGKSKFL